MLCCLCDIPSNISPAKQGFGDTLLYNILHQITGLAQKEKNEIILMTTKPLCEYMILSRESLDALRSIEHETEYAVTALSLKLRGCDMTLYRDPVSKEWDSTHRGNLYPIGSELAYTVKNLCKSTLSSK